MDLSRFFFGVPLRNQKHSKHQPLFPFVESFFFCYSRLKTTSAAITPLQEHYRKLLLQKSFASAIHYVLQTLDLMEKLKKNVGLASDRLLCPGSSTHSYYLLNSSPHIGKNTYKVAYVSKPSIRWQSPENSRHVRGCEQLQAIFGVTSFSATVLILCSITTCSIKPLLRKLPSQNSTKPAKHA